MGVASLDRDADTSPNIDDLDQLAGTATDYDLVQWRSNGQRYTGVQPSQLQVKPLSGTALLTLEDYLNGVVDARFYGFGKSGNTPAQNATALAAAGAAAQGKVLLLPNQTVTVTGTKATAIVTVGASGMKIIGAGGKYGSVIAWDNLNDCVIFGAVDRDNVVLHGVGFDGGVTAARVQWQRAFVFRGCQRVEVTDCWFYRMGDGCGLIGTQGFGGSDGVADGTRRSERIYIHNNIVESCWGTVGFVTKFNGAADIHISQNKFISSCGAAISVESEDSTTAHNYWAERIQITDNQIYDCNYSYTSGASPVAYGIVCTENCRKVIITGNIVDGVTGNTLAAGITGGTSPSQDDEEIRECIIANNAVGGVLANTNRGHSFLISLGDASINTISITGNISYASKVGYTFDLASGAATLGEIRGLTVANNTVYGAGITEFGFWTQNVSSSGDLPLRGTPFTGNNVYGCTSHGFSVYSIECSFSGNTVVGCGGAGITFNTGSKNNTGGANTITDCGGNGVTGDLTGLQWGANTILRCGQTSSTGYGIYATAGTGMMLRGRSGDDGLANLRIATTTANIRYDSFRYYIAGVEYTLAASAAGGIAPGNDVVPIATFGCIALEVGTDGVVDVIEAANNATGYASAALARAGLPAKQANHVRFANLVVTKSDGAFTFGTTSLNAANVTATYRSAIQDYGVRSANNGQDIKNMDLRGYALDTVFGGIGNHNTGTYDAGLNWTA